MDQIPTPQQPQSASEWFAQSPNPEPPRKPRFNKKAVAICVALVLLVGAVIGVSALGRNSRTSACLDEAAYRTLTGMIYSDAEPIDTNAAFYTYPLLFQSGKTNYDDSEPPTGAEAIEALGSFYAQYSAVPHTYSLKAPGADATLASQRLTRVKEGLVAAGIPEKFITASTLAPVATEGAEENALDELEIDTVTVTIASSQKCNQ